MAAPSFITGNPVIDLIYIILNGISEVPLISAPLAGALILTGTLIASRRAALIMVISGLIGAGVALLLGASYRAGNVWPVRVQLCPDRYGILVRTVHEIKQGHLFPFRLRCCSYRCSVDGLFPRHG